MSVRAMAMTMAAAGAAALAGAGTAAAATPNWHPGTHPSAPSGGAQPAQSVRLALGIGSSGQATLLYGAVKGALYAVSRTSPQGAWGGAQPWLASAAVSAGGSPGGGLAVAVGGKVTALWSTSSNGLANATGSTTGGGAASIVPGQSGTPNDLSIFTSPQGVDYGYSVGTSIYAASAPQRSPLPPASVIAPPAAEGAPGLQTAVDSAGNQTAAWTANGQVLVATRAAETGTWSAPAALPGSSALPFALTVAGNGKAAIAYAANVVTGSFSGTSTFGQPITLPYQASVTLAVATRTGPTAPFGGPQPVFTYAPPAPATLDQATALSAVSLPMAASAATGGGKVAVAWVVPPVNGAPGPQYLLTRGTLGGTLPAPTALPGVDEDVTSWTLTGLDTAVDPQGNAAFVIGGTETQGDVDTVRASTSTPNAPAWKALKDIAGCKQGSGVAGGPTVVASPTGGLVAAWACQGSGSATSAQGLVGLAAFDTFGPPVISYTLSGGTKKATARFTLGEAASYTLTATKGGSTVKLSGSAKARQAVSRTLTLAPGTWKVTLKGTLSTGNATSVAKNVSVSG